MNKQRFFKNWIIDAGFQFRFSFKIALAALVIGAINVSHLSVLNGYTSWYH